MAVDTKQERTRSSVFRLLGRWLLRGILALLALLLVAAGAGAVYESIARAFDAKRFPPPGRLVDIGTHRLHINCTGHGSPTVILEAGAGMWSTGWWWVQRDLAASTRVCSYDRTGMGWSDPGSDSRSLDGIETVRELHLLLQNAGERGPIVFVGHSLGGLLARIYYQQFPDDLAGMVLIEPGDPQQLLDDIPSLRRTEIRPCGRPCTMGRIAARLGAARLLVGRNQLINDPKFPPEAVAAYKARIVLPQVLIPIITLGKYLGAICRETLENRSLRDLPVVMIYGTDISGPFFKTVAEERKDVEAWTAMTRLSSRGSAPIEIKGANHLTIIAYKEYARQVSSAILGMVEKIRGGEASQHNQAR